LLKPNQILPKFARGFGSMLVHPPFKVKLRVSIDLCNAKTEDKNYSNAKGKRFD